VSIGHAGVAAEPLPDRGGEAGGVGRPDRDYVPADLPLQRLRGVKRDDLPVVDDRDPVAVLGLFDVVC